MPKQPKHANSGRPDAAKIAPFSTLERGNAAEQIAGEIHRQILNGRLSRGSRLPTEKQLASGYGVSNPTIREAIRSLATMRLIEVRHGSGAYVTADADQLLAVSLNSLIPLERMGVEDLLGTLGALNAYAAELAAANATKRDIEEMQRGLDRMDNATEADEIAEGLTHFLHALSYASHNPLLDILYRFLARLQVRFAKEITGHTIKGWRKTADKLAPYRQRLVNAIKARNVESAMSCAREYQAQSLKVIAASQPARISDPVLTKLFISSTSK